MIGPDFVGIGAARSGTSWLYEVLDRHPSIWLPPIKELHYFDDPSRSKRYYSYLRMRLISGLWVRRPFSAWDLQYFFGRPCDEWYSRLFEPGRRCGLLTGEITPAYAILDEAILERIQAINRQVKLIYLMRDPVMRCWSAVMKQGVARVLARKTQSAMPTVKAFGRGRATSTASRGLSVYSSAVRSSMDSLTNSVMIRMH